MYTFRVLREGEEYIANTGIIYANNGIPLLPAASIIGPYQNIGQTLDDSISHIQNGSKKLYGWISTSKSLINVLDTYSCVNNNNENIKKPFIALIAEYDRNCLKLSGQPNENFLDFSKHSKEEIEQIRIIYSENISKLVLDMSTREAQQLLFDNGVILTKSGTKPQTTSRACNYATNSSEVLVFEEIHLRKIPSFIDNILTPLESDLLYNILKKGIKYENEMYEYMYLHIFRNFLKNFDLSTILNDVEMDFYKLHYVERIQFAAISYYYSDQKNKESYLKYLNAFGKIKASILQKILLLYDVQLRKQNIDTEYIYFPEYPYYSTPNETKEKILKYIPEKKLRNY